MHVFLHTQVAAAAAATEYRVVLWEYTLFVSGSNLSVIVCATILPQCLARTYIYIYICINLCMYVNNGIFVIWLKIVVCIAYCCVSANLPLKWLEKWSSKTHDNAMNEHCSNRMYCCWREAMSQSFTIKCIMIVVQVLCALSQQPRYYNGVKR